MPLKKLDQELDIEVVERLAASVAGHGRLQPLEIELASAMGDGGAGSENFHMAHIASIVTRSFNLA